MKSRIWLFAGASFLVAGCSPSGANDLDPSRGGAAGAPGAGGGTGSPTVHCGIAGVISNHCTECHSSPPRYTAPMSLMTPADFHVKSSSGGPMWS